MHGILIRLALLAALFLSGLGMGYLWRAGSDRSEALNQRIQALESERIETAEQTLRLYARDAELVGELEEVRTRAELDRQRLARWNPPKPNPPKEPTHDYAPACACDDLRAVHLNVGTVRVLNDGRAGAQTDPGPALGAEEGLATSATTCFDLAESDREVSRLYHELAKRHDVLVDAILEHNRKALEHGAANE